MGILTLLFTVLSGAISLTSLSFSFITCQMGIMLFLLLLPPPSLPFPSFPPLPFSFPLLFLLLLHLFQEREAFFEPPEPWGSVGDHPAGEGGGGCRSAWPLIISSQF